MAEMGKEGEIVSNGLFRLFLKAIEKEGNTENQFVQIRRRNATLLSTTQQ